MDKWNKSIKPFYDQNIRDIYDACKGFEKKDRQRGIALLVEQFLKLRGERVQALDRIAAGSPQKIKRLAGSYKRMIREYSEQAVLHLRKQKTIPEVLAAADPARYLEAIEEGVRSLEQLEDTLQSFVRRLKEIKKIAAKPMRPRRHLQRIENIHPDFCVAFRENLHPLSFFEINDAGSKSFWDSIILLSRTFLPNEINSPKDYTSYLEEKNHAEGAIVEVEIGGTVRKHWNKWIMVCALDETGRLLGAADGAIIVNHEMALFYFSHVAVDEKSRIRGIGSHLTAAALQAANQAIPFGWKALGLKGQHPEAGAHFLDCEVSEIEFPDTTFAGINSIRRLPFHGRMHRCAIWPLLYSQPDTDYTLPAFDPKMWNSVPMFLAFRAFPLEESNAAKALAAADLAFDYFIQEMGTGATWDREYMMNALAANGPISLIPFPTEKSGVDDFIKKTGTLPELLEKYYPSHKFTVDFFN